jgi:hypothetical protein
MKKGIIAVIVALTFALVSSVYADKELPVYKKGDSVYVCACGESCDCMTMSRKAGKCSCDNEMAKTVVEKVESGKIFVQVKGKEQTFPVKAKYACACGEGCTCGTVSQKAGKCSCGNAMKKVE